MRSEHQYQMQIAKLSPKWTGRGKITMNLYGLLIITYKYVASQGYETQLLPSDLLLDLLQAPNKTQLLMAVLWLGAGGLGYVTYVERRKVENVTTSAVAVDNFLL
ncbi:hypothetical protein QAD02_023673 [Eretmocerus hayati]|uniref:Uncharacterized protein n=1 Tax=Eretmocerus hayati TaxID=131215 RepID=A0ACC2PWL1_9HYME|nr:hypothetical protein QAD02_023673 [Eretmocerus hayati]